MSSVFDGTASVIVQFPPSDSSSTSVTSPPTCAAAEAAAYPAGPPPRMTSFIAAVYDLRMSQLASTIDVAGIRAGFPSIDGDRVFLDNPGGTQVHRSVYDAVESYYRDSNANLGGPFVTSKASDRILEEARSEAAAFLGAASGSEIVFGANMTTLTMHASRILCRGLGPGDEILVTGLDHDANVAPWMLAASDRGVTIRQAGIDTETCLVDVDDFASKLSGRTRVAAFGWASNGAGTINDVARLAALCREAGALSYIDAVHYAPHGAIDVGTIGCDFLVCSAYKFFGPHVGILYGRSELLAQHRPYKVRPAPDEPPHSWETGTINLEGIAGTAAAIGYLRGLGIDRVSAYERDLSARLLEGLESIAGVTVYGTRDLDRRCPTYAFNVAGQHPAAVSAALAEPQHLRLGRQLLRPRADAAARDRRLWRRGPGRRRPLQHDRGDRRLPGGRRLRLAGTVWHMKVGALLAGVLVAAALAGTLWTSTRGTDHHAAAAPPTAAPSRLPTLAEGSLPCSTQRTAALTAGLVQARGDTYAALAGVRVGTVHPGVLADAIGEWMTAVDDGRRCLGPRAVITQNRAIGRVLLQIGG